MYSMTSFTQNRREIHATKRMRKNVITLTLIVVVSLCSILPRAIHGLCVQGRANSENTLTFIRIANNFLLLNPLCDPFIYIFRIKEFRDRFHFKCCRSNKVQTLVERPVSTTNVFTIN